MKKSTQILLVIGLAGVALLGSVVMLRNTIIKLAIEQGVTSTTGARLSIQKMSVGLTNAAVDIRGLRLHNPWGFHEDLMVDIPRVAVDVKGGDLLKGKLHVESVVLHLNEFIVIKNEKGEVNINALKPIKEGKQQAQAARQRPAGKPPQIQIDYLEYSLGKVVYKDYSHGRPPTVQEFPINVTRKYTNVTNPTFIASVIIADTITRSAVARLANVDISGATSIVSTTLKEGAQSAGDAAQGIVDTLRQIFK